MTRDKELMRRVSDYASVQMKQCPGVSESSALEILGSVSLWLHEYYRHCEEPNKHPLPKLMLKNAHELL